MDTPIWVPDIAGHHSNLPNLFLTSCPDKFCHWRVSSLEHFSFFPRPCQNWRQSKGIIWCPISQSMLTEKLTEISSSNTLLENTFPQNTFFQNTWQGMFYSKKCLKCRVVTLGSHLKLLITISEGTA